MLGITETELDTCTALSSAQLQAYVLRPPQARPRKNVADSKKKTKHIEKKRTAAIKPILGRINAPRLPNGRYQKLQPPVSPKTHQRSSPSPTKSSTAVAATWNREPDATSTSPTISSPSNTYLSSDLATLIYSTLILDHVKSNSNLELNLNKNHFCNLVCPQFISFLDNALSAEPNS